MQQTGDHPKQLTEEYCEKDAYLAQKTIHRILRFLSEGSAGIIACDRMIDKNKGLGKRKRSGKPLRFLYE